MKRIRHPLGAWIVAVAMAFAVPASAQTPSESHLRAAWTAAQATGAVFLFDQALPDIADRLSTEMKDLRPDIADLIDEIVYDVALELVPRRLDLNNQIAMIWAEEFTEDELNQIIAFYQSDIGQKLNGAYAQLQQQGLQILDTWYRRTGEEVRERTLLRLQQQGIDF